MWPSPETRRTGMGCGPQDRLAGRSGHFSSKWCPCGCPPAVCISSHPRSGQMWARIPFSPGAFLSVICPGACWLLAVPAHILGLSLPLVSVLICKRQFPQSLLPQPLPFPSPSLHTEMLCHWLGLSLWRRLRLPTAPSLPYSRDHRGLRLNTRFTRPLPGKSQFRIEVEELVCLTGPPDHLSSENLRTPCPGLARVPPSQNLRGSVPDQDAAHALTMPTALVLVPYVDI